MLAPAKLGVLTAVVGTLWSGSAHAGAESVGAAPFAPDPIIDGDLVEACGWPGAVAVEHRWETCTGTLVHPRLVITAAHCGDVEQVHFGESWRNPARTVSVSECSGNPEFGGTVPSRHDFQYCLLSEPVDDVPIVPILMGCEADVISAGREVAAVGFGRTSPGQNDYGTKREITWQISTIDLSDGYRGGHVYCKALDGKSTCSGDSGGPLYVRLDASLGGDGTWRLMGVNSFNYNDCYDGTGFVLLHLAVPWIEARSGIDITPCHDADGTWAPGPDCGFFPTDPATGVGGWPSCEIGPVGGLSSTCGPPLSGDDGDPPIVTIVRPDDGEELEPTGELTNVTIEVEADDRDGWGVAQVHLEIDGVANEDAAKATPPYQWTASFPVGTYEVTAVAEDRAGNEGRSTVLFGVGEAPPSDGGSDDPTGDDGDDGGGDDGDPDDPDEGEGPDAGADDEAGAEGCGCRATPDRGGVLPWLVLVAPLVRPRRRVGEAVS